MDDTISRRAAIDAANDWLLDCFNIPKQNRSCGLIRRLEDLPPAQPERKAPISYKEQLSLDCSFCRQHECGDTLYESSDWDGGIGFDYIRNIQFCPICGRKLYGDE